MPIVGEKECIVGLCTIPGPEVDGDEGTPESDSPASEMLLMLAALRCVPRRCSGELLCAALARFEDEMEPNSDTETGREPCFVGLGEREGGVGA